MPIETCVAHHGTDQVLAKLKPRVKYFLVFPRTSEIVRKLLNNLRQKKKKDVCVHEARATRSICTRAQRARVCMRVADSTVFARVDPDGFTVINSLGYEGHDLKYIFELSRRTHVVDITMLAYDPAGQHSCIRISRFNGSSRL